MANDFNSIINEIMPLVNEGSDIPFILSRSGGKWEIEYISLSADKIEDYFDSVREEKDNCAVMYTGADFAKGSLPYVYDKILKERLVLESDSWDDLGDAVAHFIDDIDENIAALSPEAAEYLANLDYPVEWLIGIPTPSLLQRIENEVADVSKPVPEAKKSKRDIDGYSELNSFNISGRVVILAEKEGADEPYLVCEGRWDNPLGVTEYYNAIVTDDYLEAVGEFMRRETGLLEFLNHERTRSGMPFQTLTAEDCVPGGLDENIEGKVIIIKPEALSREFRSAEYMLKICRGGNGSRPEARGNAVFCENLYDGKQSRFERYDVLGVANLDRLPEWARNIVAATQNPESLAPKITSRESSGWVKGIVGSFSFEAKVYDKGSKHGIDNGRVSKLSIHNSLGASRTCVANYDRDWDTKPETPYHKAVYNSIMKQLENLERDTPDISVTSEAVKPLAEQHKECASAIDDAVSAVRVSGEMAGTATYNFNTALNNLNSKYGSECVSAVLAAIIARSDHDGRYSNGNKAWAKAFDSVEMEDVQHSIRHSTVSTHPTVLDGLVSKARELQVAAQKSEQTKPSSTKNKKVAAEPPKKQSLLADLDASIVEAAQLAERKGGGHTKKRGDLEVD
ncbi:hypothetical protein FACS1894219_02280 [Clostridia bacterium]|nr:hypothetical protein FACS1894219_02280 [Clostridia bacterium]